MNSCCNSGAALLGLLLVSACTDTGTSPIPSPGLCRADATPISTIQGDGYYSPLQDSFATTQGTVTRIKKGEGVCLYPEGTRSTDGRITAFKPGFGLLCRRSKSPVVPALVDGAFECWPRQRKLFSPGPVVVWFGKPLPPERIRQMSNEQLADWLTETLRQMQHTCRLQQGKEPYDYSE